MSSYSSSSSSSQLPDYYSLLNVDPSATAEEIRTAYKRLSLQTHPDRFPNASREQRERLTRKFQTLADAYYVLSNTERRAEYDGLRSTRGSTAFDAGQEEEEQSSSANFFSNFFSQAAGAAAGAAGSGSSSGGSGGSGGRGGRRTGNQSEAFESDGQPQANGVFNGVFEEMLRPEVHRVVPIWKWIGAASGAGLGFILGNVPGALGGAFVGNRLGAVRDAKGKSVGEVFMNLNQGQRAEVLKGLASKVLGSL